MTQLTTWSSNSVALLGSKCRGSGPITPQSTWSGSCTDTSAYVSTIKAKLASDPSIDEQPRLQGYISVDSLWFYKKNGTILGANQSIATGPVILDKTNSAQVQEHAKAGDR